MAQEKEEPPAARRRRGESGNPRGPGRGFGARCPGPTLFALAKLEGSAVPSGRRRSERATRYPRRESLSRERRGESSEGLFSPGPEGPGTFPPLHNPDRAYPASSPWRRGNGCDFRTRSRERGGGKRQARRPRGVDLPPPRARGSPRGKKRRRDTLSRFFSPISYWLCVGRGMDLRDKAGPGEPPHRGSVTSPRSPRVPATISARCTRLPNAAATTRLGVVHKKPYATELLRIS